MQKGIPKGRPVGIFKDFIYLSCTEVLMRLQAQISVSRKKDKAWLIELHRHVGHAHSLAAVLDEIMVDAHPDQYTKARAALASYRRAEDVLEKD